MNILGKGNIVKEYIEKFNGLSKNALAAKLHFDHPLIFGDKEDARAMIRYYTGCTGDKVRKRATHKGYLIPKSTAKKREVKHLEAKYNNILWLSDIHCPNHDELAISLALDYGEENKINCIILGGDIIDNNPFTKHDKKPDRGEARAMFEATYDFLLHLRLTFPDAHIIWLEGNHDKWYEKFLAKNAPMIWDDKYFTLQSRLKLDELGIEYYHEKIILKIDNLNCLHGHTLNRGSFNPVNPARGIFLRSKTNTIIGHCHQSSKHVESNLNGKIIGCYSTGCLCTLTPDYDPHNTKHNLGFAHITRGKGNFHVRNLEIYNGQIL